MAASLIGLGLSARRCLGDVFQQEVDLFSLQGSCSFTGISMDDLGSMSVCR